VVQAQGIGRNAPTADPTISTATPGTTVGPATGGRWAGAAPGAGVAPAAQELAPPVVTAAGNGGGGLSASTSTSSTGDVAVGGRLSGQAPGVATTGPLATPSNGTGTGTSTGLSTGAGNASGVTASGPAAGSSDGGRLANLPTFGGAAGLTVASGAGPSSGGGEPGANPLAPFYNAVVLSQVLAPPNLAGGSGGTSTIGKGSPTAPATSSTTTDPQSSTTGSAGGAGLVRRENVVLDATTGVPAKTNVAEISPPPLDLQGGITALPAVQVGDTLRQDSAAADRSAIADGAAVTLATPEPSPAVPLIVAAVAYFGFNAFRRHRTSRRNGGEATGRCGARNRS
jgi:hypothetical protein